MNHFIASTQRQHFNEGRNNRHNPKIRFRCTSLVDNDGLGKRVLPVSHDQRSPHYFLPVSLHFCRTQTIPLIIQHFPTWRLEPQTLVAWKRLVALENSENFVVDMSQYRDVLATNAAIKRAGLCRNICGPSRKKLTNITGPPRLVPFISPLGPHSSPGLTHVTLIAAFVAGITQSENSTGRPLRYWLKISSNSVNGKCAWKKPSRMERSIMSVRKKLCWTTNKSRKENIIWRCK